VIPPIVYDTGALVAAERGDLALTMLHRQATTTGLRPIVPVVLAQAWRGGPQARLSLLLKGCLVLPDDERLARAAGVACAAAGTTDVVDALVVVTAAALRATVITSDPDDLHQLADAISVRLAIRRI